MDCLAPHISQTRTITAAVLKCGLIFCLPLLALGEEPVTARWPSERQAGRFLIHATFDLKNQEPLLQELSALEEDVAATLRLTAGRQNIHVFLFDRKSLYRAYLNQHFPGAPSRQALFIKRAGPGMVFAYASDDLAVDLRHESTHAVLHSTLPAVPLWMDEGLAEYFEVPAADRAGNNPHKTNIVWAARLGSVARIEQLEVIDDLSNMGAGEYRDSWAWIHFMLHGPPEARAELLGYLSDLESRVPSDRLSVRLRRKVANLDRRFYDHIRTKMTR